MDSTQENVTGRVRLKLYKGNCWVVGSQPHILYIMRTLSPLGRMRCTIKKDAEGFINLYGLPLTISALMKEKLEKSKEWEEK